MPDKIIDNVDARDWLFILSLFMEWRKLKIEILLGFIVLKEKSYVNVSCYALVGVLSSSPDVSVESFLFQCIRSITVSGAQQKSFSLSISPMVVVHYSQKYRSVLCCHGRRLCVLA